MTYHTIVADPPWPMPSGGPYKGSARYKKPPSSLPYPTMTIEQIQGLDVPAAKDAHLYLWTPNAFLEHVHGVARAWGFKPAQMLAWVKTPRGLGLGGTFTNTVEFVLFARRGTLKATRRVDTSWFHWTRPHNKHSAKPQAFLDLVEEVSPGPYLEMFAREKRSGWDSWGDEIESDLEIAS